ncbi:MAG: hypothetical protein ACOY90_19265 [Candidatus Zhuqueibacterota bacterium]
MIFQSIQSGFRQAWAYKKIALIFFLTNALFAAIIAFFFQESLSAFLGSSLAGGRIFKSPDMDIVFEFLKYKGDSIRTIFLLAAVISVLNRLAMLYLSGGALAILDSDQPFTGERFWTGSARYFGRFLRLAGLALPLLILLFLVPYVYSWIERLVFGENPLQHITFWGGWIKTGLRYGILLLWAMLLDYGRIFTVLTEENTMRIALSTSLDFIFKNFIVAFLIALIMALIRTGALAGYALVSYFAPPTTLVFVVALWCLQQGYFLLSAFLKVALYASQMHFFTARYVKPEPVIRVSDTSETHFDT